MLLHAYAIKSPYNDVQLDLVKRHVILEQNSAIFLFFIFYCSTYVLFSVIGAIQIRDADADDDDKPREAFRDINLRNILLPLKPELRATEGH